MVSSFLDSASSHPIFYSITALSSFGGYSTSGYSSFKGSVETVSSFGGSTIAALVSTSLGGSTTVISSFLASSITASSFGISYY